MYPTNATIYKATYKELTGRILHLHFVAVIAYMNEHMNVCVPPQARLAGGSRHCVLNISIRSPVRSSATRLVNTLGIENE